MNSTSTSGFLASLCLHLLLVVVVLFAPLFAKEPMPTTPGKVIIGMVTIGKGGPPKKGTDSPPPPPPPADNRPDPVQPVVNPTEPVVAPPPPPPKDAVPVKPIEPVVPVTPPKPEDKPKPTEQPKPVDKPKPTPPKPTPAKPKPGANLNSAISDIAKNTKDDGTGSSLDNALADLGAELGDDKATGDGGLGGGDGIGILGAYEDSVYSRVKPNWSWPERADRKQFTAKVNLKIAKDGTITESRIVRPSGNPAFDATVLRAVRATRTLEPPPNPAAMDVNINFNSEDLAR